MEKKEELEQQEKDFELPDFIAQAEEIQAVEDEIQEIEATYEPYSQALLIADQSCDPLDWSQLEIKSLFTMRTQ